MALENDELCVLNNLMYDEGVRNQISMAYSAGESITIGEAVERASKSSCPKEKSIKTFVITFKAATRTSLTLR